MKKLIIKTLFVFCLAIPTISLAQGFPELYKPQCPTNRAPLPTDFDQTVTLSKSQFNSFSFTAQFVKANNPSRNTKWQGLWFGYRLNNDHRLARRAVNELGQGFIRATRNGLGTNNASGVLEINPSRMTIGTYYFYIVPVAFDGSVGERRITRVNIVA